MTYIISLRIIEGWLSVKLFAYKLGVIVCWWLYVCVASSHVRLIKRSSQSQLREDRPASQPIWEIFNIL